MTNYDQWRDMADPEEPPRYECTITHLDTCYPDYFQGFSTLHGTDEDECVAVPVDGASTNADVIEGIDHDVSGDFWTDKHRDAFDNAIETLRQIERKAGTLDKPFDDSLDVSTEDKPTEIYAYFGVRFTPVYDEIEDT